MRGGTGGGDILDAHMTPSSPANTHPDDHLGIIGCTLLFTASGAKKSNCDLMPANLVPLVLAAVKNDPNLQPGTLSPFIEGCVRDVWGPAKLGRLKEAARTKLFRSFTFYLMKRTGGTAVCTD